MELHLFSHMNLVPQNGNGSLLNTLVKFWCKHCNCYEKREMSIKRLFRNLFIVQLLIPLFYSFSQTLSNGQITFNFNGTVDGNFNSITEDSIPTGILINQENSENSQIIVAGISNQNENSFNVFLSVLQDTVFPLQQETGKYQVRGMKMIL